MGSEVLIRFGAQALEKARAAAQATKRAIREAIKSVKDRDLRFELQQRFREEQKVQALELQSRARDRRRLQARVEELARGGEDNAGRGTLHAARRGIAGIGRAQAAVETLREGDAVDIAFGVAQALPIPVVRDVAAILGFVKRLVDERINDAEEKRRAEARAELEARFVELEARARQDRDPRNFSAQLRDQLRAEERLVEQHLLVPPEGW